VGKPAGLDSIHHLRRISGQAIAVESGQLAGEAVAAHPLGIEKFDRMQIGRQRDEARKLGESGRMHLMYAREGAAKYAASRRRTSRADVLQATIDAELAKMEEEDAG